MTQTLRTTFTLRNLTEQTLQDLAAMNPQDAFAKLHKWAFGDLKHCVSVQIGAANTFGDRVRLNLAMKAGAKFDTFKIEPRRGYRLASFEIQA